jgi:ABC-type transport system involved in cytochrome bd biosynthesis fused ATPase/permease subunit
MCICLTAVSVLLPGVCCCFWQLSNISFAYPSNPGTPVLHELSLTIGPGEVVAAVGPSGVTNNHTALAVVNAI